MNQLTTYPFDMEKLEDIFHEMNEAEYQIRLNEPNE